jgi:hypothetical protein
MNLNTQAREAMNRSQAYSQPQSQLATCELPARPAHTIKGSAVHRKHLRFPFVAQAEVTTVRKGWHLVADVSELSARGCYLDTPEPFSAGTEVHLCIRHAGRRCELLGRVIYAHKGWGMGILFDDAAGQQFDTLDGWLAELEQSQGGKAWKVARR